MTETAPACPAFPPAYRGRFAPTPSGPLHLGSLFTALAGFLEARARRGQWLLRIDDLDPLRSRRDAADAILATLDALGLHWDGPVLRQSRRTAAYRAGLSRLDVAGLVYPCRCTRKELEPTSVYPGTCRTLRPGSLAEPHALRVRVPDLAVSFADRWQGTIRQALATEVGDFILFRRDGVHAYHLATVLDDAELGITEVLRGVDLLDSTPRQIFLQQELGLPGTGFAHLPILVDRAGQKLGKSALAPAAATRNPGALLCRLLELLRQAPPAELAGAPAAEVLAWAVGHWQPRPLTGLQTIAVDPADFGATGPTPPNLAPGTPRPGSGT